MTNLSYEKLKTGYLKLWHKAQVHTNRQAELDYTIEHLIVSRKKRYQAVESVLRIPWYVVAVLHYREADCDFNRHLHNGDPLSERTVHVPAGRPTAGNPPFSWEESATDALHYEGLDEVKNWCLSSILWNCEKFGGFGHFPYDINSSYLWSGTNQYKSGKVDEQLGVAALLKWLEHKKLIILQGG